MVARQELEKAVKKRLIEIFTPYMDKLDKNFIKVSLIYDYWDNGVELFFPDSRGEISDDDFYSDYHQVEFGVDYGELQCLMAIIEESEITVYRSDVKRTG